MWKNSKRASFLKLLLIDVNIPQRTNTITITSPDLLLSLHHYYFYYLNVSPSSPLKKLNATP
jgi:hypothetical protein